MRSPNPCPVIKIRTLAEDIKNFHFFISLVTQQTLHLSMYEFLTSDGFIFILVRAVGKTILFTQRPLI